MTDGNPRNLELRSSVRAADGLRVFQFSLSSLFVLVTVAALILSTYFGVGKLLGMSTMEVLTQGLGRLVFTAPFLLIWIVGLTVAIRRLKRNRLPAILTIIALGGLVLTSFVCEVVEMALWHSLNSNRISPEYFSWSYSVIGIINLVLGTVVWILILVAIFAQRPPDTPETERNDPSGDPFLTNES